MDEDSDHVEPRDVAHCLAPPEKFLTSSAWWEARYYVRVDVNIHHDANGIVSIFTTRRGDGPCYAYLVQSLAEMSQRRRIDVVVMSPEAMKVEVERLRPSVRPHLFDREVAAALDVVGHRTNW